jgi:hypothetical protein
VPLKQLLERVKYSSDFHILISGGMLPEKMLFEILKDESSVQFEKYSSGMLPLRLLLPASKNTILFILEKDSGKLPESMLELRSIMKRSVRLPSDCGTTPENMLELRSRPSKLGTISDKFSGMEPEKVLPERSRITSLTLVRFRMNSGKVPLRLLS